MTKAIQIITNRVDATGLTGASVVQQGKNQIVVSVPEPARRRWPVWSARRHCCGCGRCCW